MKIGLKFKILRKLKKLTLLSCAKIIGHSSHVSIILKESGKNEITANELQQISAFFQVPPEIFFYDQEGFIGYLYSAFDPEEVDRVLEQVMQVEKAGV